MIARLTSGGGAGGVVNQASGESGGPNLLFLGGAAVAVWYAVKNL